MTFSVYKKFFINIFIFLIILFSPFQVIKAEEDGAVILKKTMGTVESTGVRVDKLIYSSDGLKVKAWVFLPSYAIESETKAPIIIYNHDGVYGLSDETKQMCKDMAACSNYIIVAPTYRGEDGSEGEIEVALGEVNDVLNLMKALSSYEFADTERIALFGTSHGALISVKAAARNTSGEIKCIVPAYGVMDIFTWWDYLTRDGYSANDRLSKKIYGGGPEECPEAFHERMGVTKAYFINCPVLIVHGALDDIVPLNQSYILAKALREMNKNYELKVYPNSGHGFLVYAPYAEDDDIYSEDEQKEAKEALEYILYFIGKYL